MNVRPPSALLNPGTRRKLLDAACGKMGRNPVVQDRKGSSETPDDSGGGSVIVLIGAGVMTMHVVALQPPGKTLQAKLVVDASAHVNEKRIVDKSAGVQMADPGHGMDEGTPSSDIRRDANTAYTVVLFHAPPGECAGIEHKPQSGKARKRQVFEGNVQAFVALLVHHVGELAVGNSAVDVSTGKKAVELCRHRNGEQQQAHEGQHGGSGFRHEISLPGARAGKQAL